MELKPERSSQTITLEQLLIVPYGIETLPTQFLQGSKGPFNRTLWN